MGRRRILIGVSAVLFTLALVEVVLATILSTRLPRIRALIAHNAQVIGYVVSITPKNSKANEIRYTYTWFGRPYTRRELGRYVPRSAPTSGTIPVYVDTSRPSTASINPGARLEYEQFLIRFGFGTAAALTCIGGLALWRLRRMVWG